MACRVLPEMLESRCNILIYLVPSVLSHLQDVHEKSEPVLPDPTGMRSGPRALHSTGTMAQFKLVRLGAGRYSSPSLIGQQVDSKLAI